MSSEVQSDISEAFQVAQKEVELAIKKLEDNNYGDSVEELSIIPIVVDLSPELEEAGFFKERVKFSRKNKETDIRLRIDYDTFCKADKETQKKLIIKNMIDSIRMLQLKVKKGFDGTALEADILKLFNLNN